MAMTMSFRALILAAGSWLLLQPGFAQRPGNTTPAPPSTGGGPGGNTGGRGPGPGTTSNPNTIGQPNPNNPNPVPGRPIFITGHVMMDDGSELPRNVAIERVCGTAIRVEGHTDSKGYFSIELGSPNADAFQDASTSGTDDFGRLGPAGGFGAPPGGSGFDRRLLLNCELRARMAGYQSQTVDLTTRQPLDNPDIGTILLHRLAGTEGTTVSATTLAAPKNARKAYQKGLELEKKKKMDQAQASFQQAVDLYPKYAEAWLALGQAQANAGQMEPARKSFDAAISADANFVPPYIQISMMDIQAQHWQELADMSDKAVRLDPFTYPQAFFFNAVANYNLHKVEAAEQSALRAQKLDTQHRMPQVSHLLGVILAGRNDYAGAAAQMRDYLKFAPQAPDAAEVRSQLEAFEKQAAAARN